MVGGFPGEKLREFVDKLTEANKTSKLKININPGKSMQVFSEVISFEQGENEKIKMNDYDAVVKELVKTYKSKKVKEALDIVDSVVKDFTFSKTGK